MVYRARQRDKRDLAEDAIYVQQGKAVDEENVQRAQSDLHADL